MGLLNRRCTGRNFSKNVYASNLANMLINFHRTQKIFRHLLKKSTFTFLVLRYRMDDGSSSSETDPDDCDEPEPVVGRRAIKDKEAPKKVCDSEFL